MLRFFSTCHVVGGVLSLYCCRIYYCVHGVFLREDTSIVNVIESATNQSQGIALQVVTRDCRVASLIAMTMYYLNLKEMPFSYGVFCLPFYILPISAINLFKSSPCFSSCIYRIRKITINCVDIWAGWGYSDFC